MDKTIILVSNVVDSRNTSSAHFFNRLSSPLQLSTDGNVGEWHVGLRKIIYVDTTHNIPTGSYINIEHHADTGRIRNPDQEPWKLEGLLPPDLNLYFRMSDKPDRTYLEISVNPYKHKAKITMRYLDIWYRLGSDSDIHKKRVYFEKHPDGGTVQFEEGYWAAGNHNIGENSSVNDLYVQSVYWKTDHIVVQPDYYDNLDDLLESINSAISHLHKWMSFKYNKGTKRVVAEVKSILVNTISFSKNLQIVLGFSSNSAVIEPNPGRTYEYAGDKEAHLRGGLFPIHVLTNIVDSMSMGSTTFQPILETIAVQSHREHFGAIVEHVFKAPMYRPVTTTSAIEEIEIKIVDDMGELVQFENTRGDAKVLLVLHLVKR